MVVVLHHGMPTKVILVVMVLEETKVVLVVMEIELLAIAQYLIKVSLVELQVVQTPMVVAAVAVLVPQVVLQQDLVLLTLMVDLVVLENNYLVSPVQL